MVQRGRRRIYESDSEKMKAYRQSKKDGGSIYVGCYLPSEYRKQLRQMCRETNFTISGAICYLLDLYYSDVQDNGGEFP